MFMTVNKALPLTVPGRHAEPLKSVRRHRRFALAIGAVLVSAGIAAAIIYGRHQYEAAAEVLVSPAFPTVAPGGTSHFNSNQEYRDFVDQQVAEIDSYATTSAALNLLGAITGIPLLSMAKGFVQTLADGVKGVQDWAAGAFTTAQTWLEGTFHKVVDFIKPYAEVLCSVATAMVNPAGIPLILAGWAWRWLPDCIKPPLIDLLLDAVIGFLTQR